MWQRIQTLYLILAIILNASLFGLSLASFSVDAMERSFGLMGFENGKDYQTVILPLITSASILLSLVVILMFRKRQLQIKLSQLNLFVQAALVAAIFFLIDEGVKSLGLTEGVEVDYGIGTIISLLPLLFIYLAIRGIKKDEALIRAADRIR